MIAAYMLTCPERVAIREEAVRSFAETDWGAGIEVYLNEVTEGRPEQRMAVGTLALLRRALAGTCDYFLICEDDVLFDPRLWARLAVWGPLRAGKVEMASLYNLGAMAVGVSPFADAIAVDPESALGSQARLFSRGCAELIVREYRPSAWLHDVAMARLAARRGPIFYHVPSLVQHVGRESTWGGPFHEALDFTGAA